MIKADKTVLTTCPYCGVGCQMNLKVRDGYIYRVDAPFVAGAQVVADGDAFAARGQRRGQVGADEAGTAGYHDHAVMPLLVHGSFSAPL